MGQAEIALYRPILLSVAFSMTGCKSTAEDMVQDTFFKCLKLDSSNIRDLKSYLIRTTTNTCLNYLKALKVKKEDLIDTFSPSFASISINTDITSMDIKCEITQALSQIFKKLPPSERVVFVLKEIFNFDYSDLTDVLNKKSDNCRKLFSRAQTKLSEETERFQIDSIKLKSVVNSFKKASLGEFSGLIENLKADLS